MHRVVAEPQATPSSHNPISGTRVHEHERVATHDTAHTSQPPNRSSHQNHEQFEKCSRECRHAATFRTENNRQEPFVQQRDCCASAPPPKQSTSHQCSREPGCVAKTQVAAIRVHSVPPQEIRHVHSLHDQWPWKISSRVDHGSVRQKQCRPVAKRSVHL